MNFATARTAISNWLDDVTALPVYWSPRSQARWGKTWWQARFTAMRPRGVDIVQYSASGDLVTPTQSGLRDLNLELQIWSHGTADTDDSIHYVDLALSSLNLPDTVTRFSNAELGFAGVLTVTTPLQIVGDREIAFSQIDLAFNTKSELNGSDIEWVETYDMTADLYDELGNNIEHWEGEIP